MLSQSVLFKAPTAAATTGFLSLLRNCGLPTNVVCARRFGLAPTGDNAGAASGHRHFVREKVRVYKPARNPMQQGGSKDKRWKVEFQPHGKKWANPLMGWTSSQDTVTQLQMWFATKEDALRFVDEQGYEYELETPKPYTKKLKQYADRFSSHKYGFHVNKK